MMRTLVLVCAVLAMAAMAEGARSVHRSLAMVPKASAGVRLTLTAQQLGKIFISAGGATGVAQIPAKRAQSYIAPLNAAMTKWGITSCARVAAFLGNVAVESNNLLWMKELGTGKEYEGRKDLGNTQPGDGVKYKGRGPIQITGRNNYATCGIALGLDLINNPQLLEQPTYAFSSAGWFWSSRNLNTAADPNTETSFMATVKRVNGAIVPTTHYPVRKLIWQQAKKVLGC